MANRIERRITTVQGINVKTTALSASLVRGSKESVRVDRIPSNLLDELPTRELSDYGSRISNLLELLGDGNTPVESLEESSIKIIPPIIMEDNDSPLSDNDILVLADADRTTEEKDDPSKNTTIELEKRLLYLKNKFSKRISRIFDTMKTDVLGEEGDVALFERLVRSVYGEARYSVVGKIGAGGMGSVFLLTDQELNMYVAKVAFEQILRHKFPEIKETFVKEAKNLTLLAMAEKKFSKKFSGIARMIDSRDCMTYEEIGSAIFFMTEYVSGCNLTNWLKYQTIRAQRKGERNYEKLSTPEVAYIAYCLFEILDLLRRAEIKHGDFDPTDIMMDRNGKIKIIDLGVSENFTDWDGELISKGVFKGKVRYAAPELIVPFVSEERIDQESFYAADFYSLGIVLFILATGEYPEKLIEIKNLTNFLHIFSKDREILTKRDLSLLPEELKILIPLLLKRNPLERLTNTDLGIRLASYIISSCLDIF